MEQSDMPMILWLMKLNSNPYSKEMFISHFKRSFIALVKKKAGPALGQSPAYLN